MKNCPHASGMYGCNALRNAGFATSTITVSESWRDKYCTSGKYLQCSNLKAASEMKDENKKGKGDRLENKDSGYGHPPGKLANSGNAKPAVNPKGSDKNKKKGTPDPVHAHGGVPPHYCEKPWRSSGLRFRVIKSLFYLKPWK